MNGNHRLGSVAIAPLGVARAASETEPRESTILRITDVAADFEKVRTDLFKILRGATACSSTVFYGLLAWANLPTVTTQQGIGSHS
jgi:hypothetical protein